MCLLIMRGFARVSLQHADARSFELRVVHAKRFATVRCEGVVIVRTCHEILRLSNVSFPQGVN